MQVSSSLSTSQGDERKPAAFANEAQPVAFGSSRTKEDAAMLKCPPSISALQTSSASASSVPPCSNVATLGTEHSATDGFGDAPTADGTWSKNTPELSSLRNVHVSLDGIAGHSIVTSMHTTGDHTISEEGTRNESRTNAQGALQQSPRASIVKKKKSVLPNTDASVQDTFDLSQTDASLLPPPGANASISVKMDFLHQQLDGMGMEAEILPGLLLLGNGNDERLQGGVLQCIVLSSFEARCLNVLCRGKARAADTKALS
jgi:hypothetical protein